MLSTAGPHHRQQRPPAAHVHGVLRHQWRRGGAHLLVGAMLGAILMASGWTQENRGDRLNERAAYHIPSQPLDLALQVFSRASGVQVLYESELAAGRRSTPVEGRLSGEAALRGLLAGSDLVVHTISPDAITLSRHSDSPAEGGRDTPPGHPLAGVDLTLGTLRVMAPPEAGEDAALRDFNQALQADIQNALKKNARTRTGNYRVAVKLWIDPARILQKTELLESTGDAQRDTDISNVLRGLVVSRAAPANTRQPVRVVIVVKTLL
jgi:hypothetical protein